MGITNKQWITKELEKNNYDHHKLFDMYLNFQSETESTASFKTFKEMVYRIKNSISPISKSKQYKEFNFINLPSNITKEYLLFLLEEFILETKQKIKYEDLINLSKSYNFPVEAFKILIPNLNDELNNLYKLNLLNFKSEVEEIKLKRKIAHLESEVNELKNNYVNYSTIVDTLNDIIEIYNPWSRVNFKTYSTDKKRSVVSLLSDIHSGEIVSFEETRGINEYNSSIMKERIDTYFSKVIEYGEEVKSSDIYLYLLGDIVNGTIHEELVANSDLDVVESLIVSADYISKWIQYLSKFFKNIYVIALSGNHGRFSKKPNFKKRNILNFDYIAYEFIRRETSKIVKEFNLSKSPFYINMIYSYRFFSMHGELLKGGTGLNPISGTWSRDIEKLNGLFKRTEPIDYVNIGHFHKSILDIPTFSGISIIANGSLKGADEFSIGAVKSGEKPSQVIYTVEENEGVKFRTSIQLV